MTRTPRAARLYATFFLLAAYYSWGYRHDMVLLVWMLLAAGFNIGLLHAVEDPLTIPTVAPQKVKP